MEYFSTKKEALKMGRPKKAESSGRVVVFKVEISSSKLEDKVESLSIFSKVLWSLKII